MIDQTIEVTKLLKELNHADIPTSTVEKEIGIASGYLWKVKKGKKRLGEDKIKLLEDYHKKHVTKINKPVVRKIKSTPVFIHKEIKKESPQSKPGSLADMMRTIRSESGRVVGQPYKRVK